MYCFKFLFLQQKLTEGRVVMFNHEVVPDYLRTKPEPEVEEKSQQLTTKANQITQDLAQVKLHACPTKPGLFSCSTRLSMNFILLINVQMPTIVGILTFISMINTKTERLKQETSSFVDILVFMSSYNFVLSYEHEKSFITSGP